MFLFRDSLPDMNAKIRVLHAAAGANSVDVYVDGNKIASDLSFSEITSYNNISPGKHKFDIYETGNTTNPLFSDSYEIVPNETLTLNAVLLGGKLTVFVLKDNPPTNTSSSSFLRFINLSPNSPLLNLSLADNKTPLFNSVEYLETTGFYPLKPELYSFLMTNDYDSSFKKYIGNIKIKSDTSHTLFIIGLNNNEPKIGYLITDDKI
ncbi:MAG: DUF4397 domain-containing protein [Clostridium sp.]|uniref:DUF4397 domain-containing protein n=1 Tax=Clostridium sp. DSM 8431 TaxID=1761781 RepID=UPI0008E3729A|nr:DUF4397 domain-containing protein [Clostridium sp. DSM 8431]MCR4943369.1 DUF4397 domain-containing protein [Clostridium sp.]SFU76208.1 protein of unknown function [Clostridium sp. DSM 8431]